MNAQTLDAEGAATREEPSLADERQGFTFLLSLGLGFQTYSGSGLSDSALGLGGLNLGIGAFLTQDLGLMFRVSGTNVSYTAPDYSDGPSMRSVSAVGAVTIQYWPADFLKFEAGPGFGVVSLDTGFGSSGEQGFGLFAGLAFSFWQKSNHSLQLGVEYAPVFVEGLTFHNVGFTFGWQLL